MTISIHPSVGVARLGNSPNEIFLAPDKIGGLPYEVDPLGSPQFDVDGNLTGAFTQASNFKDNSGRIKRQGQLFRLFDEDTGAEITLATPNVKSIEWTVHLANKKAAWYQYNELVGNLLYGQENSYSTFAASHTREEVFRNPDKVTDQERQELIIDPGPRTISGLNEKKYFNQESVLDYPNAHFPNPEVNHGTAVTTLGELRTDFQGRLIVLGGFGNSGGDLPLTNYGGSSTWHDDISDGPVYCTVTYDDDSTEELKAWIIVGSPDFAPEIVNISTLSDTMFDVGVRNFEDFVVVDTDGRNIRNGSDWNYDYRANFQRDILPIIKRIKDYQWVSNVQSMSAFFANNFDFTDNNENPGSDAYQNRQNYFSYFRHPNGVPPTSQQQQQLFKGNSTYDFPMMPLNSGSNSVSEETIVKFLALNETQYFLLGQWAVGKFDNNPEYEPYPVHPLDTASVGNCVGLPMCPGIEVTWTVQNPEIYESAYVIKHYQDEEFYKANGLTPMRDECEGGGCEPGDLTKRMACPWQADFFQCTIQYINFTNPTKNKGDGNAVEYNSPSNSSPTTVTIPEPPTYYSYWWPPQSPWDVLTGETTAVDPVNPNADQQAPNIFVPSTDLEGAPIPKAGNSITVQNPVYLPAGQQVNYARGINSFVQMVEHWYALGFIRNQNTSEGQSDYPYLVETERNHELFNYREVPVGAITGNQYDNDTTIPVFSMEQTTGAIAAKSERAERLVAYLEERAFKAIAIAPEGLGHPRSGTRARR